MTDHLSGTTPPPDPDRYRFALSRDDVSAVLRYTHVYPNLHGYTKRFFEKNYPGSSLGEFMSVFQTAGILTKKGTKNPAGRCKDRLHTIYFSSKDCFYVRWNERGRSQGIEE